MKAGKSIRWCGLALILHQVCNTATSIYFVFKRAYREQICDYLTLDFRPSDIVSSQGSQLCPGFSIVGNILYINTTDLPSPVSEVKDDFSLKSQISPPLVFNVPAEEVPLWNFVTVVALKAKNISIPEVEWLWWCVYSFKYNIIHCDGQTDGQNC